MKPKFTFILLPVLLFSLVGCGSSNFTKTDEHAQITIDGVPWILELPNQDFRLEQENTPKPGLTGYFLMQARKCSTTVSVTVEPATKYETSREYRDSYKLSPMLGRVTQIEKRDLGNVVTNEYIVANHQEIPINQKHMNAHFVQDGFWIDIHISKVQFQAEQQACFDDLVSSIRFLPKDPKNIKMTSAGFVLMGTSFFYAQKLSQAIWCFKKALSPEQPFPISEKDLYRMTVDHLGMAYGMSGKLDDSKKLFISEIPKDPSYPLYHYNLACAYAEAAAPDSAIASLELAYRYRANMIKGEEFPNPEEDSSFKSLLTNPKFVDLVKRNQEK